MQAIVAVDPQWGIGREGQLLYRIPEDLKRFRRLTRGQVVVMGHSTFASLPKGALPDRRNLVLSRQEGLTLPGAEVLPSLQALFQALRGEDREVFVIGGAEIYALLLPYCQAALVTRVSPGRASPDAFFPNLEDPSLTSKEEWDFTLDEASEPMFYEDLTFTYCLYRNRSPRAW